MFDWILVYIVVFFFVFIFQSMVNFFDPPAKVGKKKKDKKALNSEKKL